MDSTLALSTHDDDAAWRVASLELLQHVGTTRDAEAVSTVMMTSSQVLVSISCLAAFVERPLGRLRSQTSQSSVVRGRATLCLSDFGVKTPGSDFSFELLKHVWILAAFQSFMLHVPSDSVVFMSMSMETIFLMPTLRAGDVLILAAFEFCMSSTTGVTSVVLVSFADTATQKSAAKMIIFILNMVATESRESGNTHVVVRFQESGFRFRGERKVRAQQQEVLSGTRRTF